MKKKIHILILCMLLTAMVCTSCQNNVGDTILSETSGESTDSQESGGSGQDGTVQAETDENEEKVLATDFEVTLVSGDTVKLSDFRGKKVLLNFWATWCGPCVEEMPAFQQLTEEYPDDFVILAVNCGDTVQDVESFVEENGYTFNIALDETMEVSSLYPTSSIPLTIIVDEEGYITYASYGASDAQTMYDHYKELLGLE